MNFSQLLNASRTADQREWTHHKSQRPGSELAVHSVTRQLTMVTLPLFLSTPPSFHVFYNILIRNVQVRSLVQFQHNACRQSLVLVRCSDVLNLFAGPIPTYTLCTQRDFDAHTHTHKEKNQKLGD